MTTPQDRVLKWARQKYEDPRWTTRPDGEFVVEVIRPEKEEAYPLWTVRFNLNGQGSGCNTHRARLLARAAGAMLDEAVRLVEEAPDDE